jgi:hypothetical protein
VPYAVLYVLPIVSPAWKIKSPHLPNGWSGVTVPSSERGSGPTSCCSSQPPGFRHLVVKFSDLSVVLEWTSYLNASLYTAVQSVKQPSMNRMKTRSVLLRVKVHSADASSISNLQFGGTKFGWTGDRSVPTTSADSY